MPNDEYVVRLLGTADVRDGVRALLGFGFRVVFTPSGVEAYRLTPNAKPIDTTDLAKATEALGRVAEHAPAFKTEKLVPPGSFRAGFLSIGAVVGTIASVIFAGGMSTITDRTLDGMDQFFAYVFLGGFVWMLTSQLGLGAVLGLAGGWVLSWLMALLTLPDGLYALLILSGGTLIFAATNLMSGSGFLAVYLAGVVVGNRRSHATEHVLRVMDGLAWLAQAGMFVVLGLLVTPSKMLDYATEAFAMAVFLTLVARPVAVAIGLAPFRYPRNELLYVSWVGLRLEQINRLVQMVAKEVRSNSVETALYFKQFQRWQWIQTPRLNIRNWEKFYGTIWLASRIPTCHG